MCLVLPVPWSAQALLIDVTDEDSVAAAAARLKEEHGHLDVPVNNAKVYPAMRINAVLGPDGPTGEFMDGHGVVPW
jgi:NAD(P)-dependent dehydrogenase (short-subunit alcohol dehydrogenase family)